LLLLLRATYASVQRREKGNRTPDFSNPQMQMQMQCNASKQAKHPEFAIIAPAANPPSSTPNCSKDHPFCCTAGKVSSFLTFSSYQRT
jgi:hypothetical protein